MENLKKELEDLIKGINEQAEKSTRKIGEKSLDYMMKEYSKNNLSGHIGNLNLQPIKEKYKYGFILSSGNDDIAVYNEFGTGIVGEGTNPLADDAKYQYNIGLTKGTIPDGAKKEYGEAYCESVTTPDTWWYHKNGKWWHTEGMKGKNMYSSLVEELRKHETIEFKTDIEQYIKYGGSK